MTGRGRPPAMPDLVPFYIWAMVELKLDNLEWRGHKRSRSASNACAQIAAMFQDTNIAWGFDSVWLHYKNVRRRIRTCEEDRLLAETLMEYARSVTSRESHAEDNYGFYAHALGLTSLPYPLAKRDAAKVGRSPHAKIFGDWESGPKRRRN